MRLQLCFILITILIGELRVINLIFVCMNTTKMFEKF